MCVCCENVRVMTMLVWGQGGCGCSEYVYGWYTWFRCLSNAGDMLEISVVSGVG